MARPDMLAGASNTPYWLDDPGRPAGRPALTRDTTTDLLVVGGGYTGLWTALLAKESEPDRDVVLVEAERIGWAASGRNGGFCSASLTHGAANGRERFPDEFDVLQSMGVDNLRGLRATVERFAIDCELEATGELDVATEDHQVEWLRDAADEDGAEFLDAEAVRRQVDSPTYRAGLWDRDGAVLVHPAKLAWGLARAAESLGVRIFEGTRARGIDTAGVPSGRRVLVGAGESTVTARQVVLGTNAFPSLVRRARPFVVPVYDYAIVTEPLTAAELGAIGWANRQGIGDSANQFHYYRLTADNRILFGGYDAVYHFGGRVKASYDTRRATFGLLADHLDATFPQLGGVRLSHAWGGAIDLCGRFCAFFGTARRGQVAYAAGYTGLGVGASRFAGQVMLDLLSGTETERTATEMVRSKPPPFPPEPLAWLGVQATRASIRAADRNQGRRNLWLRTLDRMGLGFDS
ncbi:MAG: FAD-dependent oxidoreductase [Nocardioidaceae bacterium]